MSATHFHPRGAEEGKALCGWLAVLVSPRREETSCKLCLRALERLPLALQPLTDAERQPRPVPPRTHDPVEARRMAARAGEVQERGYSWPSVAAAVRYYVSMRDEGASLGSTSNPDRAIRVQVNRDPSLGGREHDAIERYATVARSIGYGDTERPGALAMPLALSRACPLVTPDQAQQIYLLRVCGRDVRPQTAYRGSGERRKGTYPTRYLMTVSEVVDRVRRDHAIRIEPWHVTDVCAHFELIVGEALVASGEMNVVGRKARKERAVWDPVAECAAQIGRAA